MKPSNKLRKLHEIMEGKKAKAYKCPAGVLTIGIGHTSQEVMPFTEKTTWTEEEINHAWELDMENTVELANKVITSSISQGMFDATVDLIFNCGSGCRTYLNLVNGLNYDSAEDALLRWIHVDGVAQVGLIKRRFADLALFRGTDDWEEIAGCNATAKDIEPLNKLIAKMGYKVFPDSHTGWRVAHIDRAGNEV